MIKRFKPELEKPSIHNPCYSAFMRETENGMWVHYNAYKQSQRALWLARAERAKAMAMHHFTLSMQHKMLFGKTDSYRAEQHDLWSEIERKCRLKAEDYR